MERFEGVRPSEYLFDGQWWPLINDAAMGLKQLCKAGPFRDASDHVIQGYTDHPPGLSRRLRNRSGLGVGPLAVARKIAVAPLQNPCLGIRRQALPIPISPLPATNPPQGRPARQPSAP